MAWYKEWFGKDYSLVYGHRNEEDARAQVDLIMNTIPCKKGMKLLDLCCGDGRHAKLLHSHGFEVTGIDLSQHLIDRARKNCPPDVTFVVSDMRTIEYSGCFDIVVNLFTSFGYFNEDSENEKVIQSVSRSLVKGGYFWLDFLNTDRVIDSLQPFSRKTLNGNITVEEEKRINERNNTVEKTIRIITPEGTREYSEYVKLYGKDVLEDMFRSNGFSIVHEFGDYSGGPFDKASPRVIIAGRKEETDE